MENAESNFNKANTPVKSKKEEKFGGPTQKEIEKVLGGIEEATFNEELERKRLGLTQEPEAHGIKGPRQEKKTAWSINELVDENSRGFYEQEDEIVAENTGEYVSEWRERNASKIQGRLKFIGHIPSIEFKGDIPPFDGLLDEIIRKVIKIDENNLGGRLDVARFIKKYATRIEVMGVSSYKKIFIKIFGKNRFMRGYSGDLFIEFGRGGEIGFRKSESYQVN
jgi:hypothetical protein